MANSWMHETDKEEVLYKYRSFDSFENLVDILVNSRVYAATFDAMNDPMEGCYNFPDSYSAGDIEELESVISKQKFCSLSTSRDIDLMWAHYSNGNRGICIGVTLKSTKKSGCALRVKYEGQPNLIHRSDSKEGDDRTRRILRYKSPCWQYEEEVRLFSNEGHLIDVEIKEVIFGKRVDKKIKPLVEALITKFQPGAKVLMQGDL